MDEGNEHKNDMEDDNEEGIDDVNDRSKETEKASDLMLQDEVENEEMEEDAPVSSNKYDAIYTHTLNSNIQSSNEILMEKVIRALQEDQVTSSTFDNTHPLYLIIQDCRSVHAASIQLKNSRQMPVPWFGLKWEDEKRKTIEIREEETKAPFSNITL